MDGRVATRKSERVTVEEVRDGGGGVVVVVGVEIREIQRVVLCHDYDVLYSECEYHKVIRTGRLLLHVRMFHRR